jgi:hypothetical protein
MLSARFSSFFLYIGIFEPAATTNRRSESHEQVV